MVFSKALTGVNGIFIKLTSSLCKKSLTTLALKLPLTSVFSINTVEFCTSILAASTDDLKSELSNKGNAKT